MQNRIDRLEGLVLSLMHGGANIDASSVAAAAAAAAAAAGTNTVPGAASSTDSSSFAKIEVDENGTMRDDGDRDDSDTDDGLATSVGVLKLDVDKGKSMYIGQ